ncbi:MAG: hypothetical protein ACREQY_11970, partial [Candidatus Binatia bacterium]
ENLDRTQEVVDVDVDLDDRVLELEAWLRVAPLGGSLFLEGRVTHEDRDARIGNLRSEQVLTRWTLAVGASL